MYAKELASHSTEVPYGVDVGPCVTLTCEAYAVLVDGLEVVCKLLVLELKLAVHE